MKFVGADLHKKSITFCVVELVGRATQVVARKRILCNQVKEIAQFLRSLGACQVTVEATIGYDWFAALAEGTTGPPTLRRTVGGAVSAILEGPTKCG